jgi:hypothetical protein
LVRFAATTRRSSAKTLQRAGATRRRWRWADQRAATRDVREQKLSLLAAAAPPARVQHRTPAANNATRAAHALGTLFRPIAGHDVPLIDERAATRRRQPRRRPCAIASRRLSRVATVQRSIDAHRRAESLTPRGQTSASLYTPSGALQLSDLSGQLEVSPTEIMRHCEAEARTTTSRKALSKSLLDGIALLDLLKPVG